MASGPIIAWQIEGETKERMRDIIFLGSKITADGECSHERPLVLGRKAMTKIDSILKRRNFTLLTKIHLVKATVSSSSHIWVWELHHEERRAPENWCFWTVVLKKTLESPLVCKEIKLVHPKGNQSLIFIGKTDTEAETPILWRPNGKNWFIGKDPDAGKDWRQEEKGMVEDDMARWYHQLNGHEFE